MAQLLRDKEIKPVLILSSPTVCAKQTAKHYYKLLGGKLRYDEHIYEVSAISLLHLLQASFEKVDTLMLVGHNPRLTELNHMLSDITIHNLPTAAVVGIVFEEELASHKGKQLFHEYPKILLNIINVAFVCNLGYNK